MGLTAGTRLGPYEIIGAIGAGGMGEVYRARDTRLDRDVAVKVLPESFAADAGRVARFTREAKTLASLNHPNIAQIYGIEESGTTRALVMELVDGQDLSTLIDGARGLQTPGSSPGSKAPGLHLSESLAIAKQIAEALEAAHEQGIVHRDLKPANIKIRGAWGPTPTRLPDGRLAPTRSASDIADGTVKVLDFGLAKAMDPVSPESVAGRPESAMNSPTMTSPAMTAMGMILGTAVYMAPEQAKGRAVDKRADIWAFGVVLHEMLTGRRLFDAEDVSETLAAVLTRDVSVTTLPLAIPARLRALVGDCLVRDPKQRLRDIGDARRVLDKIIAGTADEAVAVTAPAGAAARPSSRVLPWTIAALLAVALVVAVWAPWRAAPATTSAALRLTPLAFEPGGQVGAAWSPDGKAVAYGARQKDTDPYQLYVRYLDAPVATQITAQAKGVQFVIRWTTAGKIVYYTAPQVWSVSPVGGEPEPWSTATLSESDRATLSKLQLVGTGDVARDGASSAGLFRGADGVVSLWTARRDSALEPYAPAPFASRSIFNNPVVQFSPDGTQILVLKNSGAGEEAWLVAYPPSAANPPHRILEGLTNSSGTPTASWMPDNRHIVLSISLSAAAPRQLYLADTVSGALTVISSGTSSQSWPAVSPDGRQLVFQETATDRDIVSMDLASAAVAPVIATQRAEQMPAWAARESAMVYVTDRNGEMEIWIRKPGQPDRPLVTKRDFPPDTTRGFMGPSLSPDGTRVIYAQVPVAGVSSLWMSAVAGGPPVRVAKNAAADSTGSWSPDGNWYVYRYQQDGRSSLAKVKTTGGAEPEVLKADLERPGGWLPLWSPAGDWILFSDAGVKLISPDGKTTRDVSSTSAVVYAFSADGQTIYGLRQPVALGRVELFSMSVTGGAEKIIGSQPRDYLPLVSLNPALRLSLTPDGKSFTYSISKTTSNLWLADGLKPLTVR